MTEKITHKPAWLSKSAPKPKIRKVQGGAEYEDVASRVQRFRHDHPFGAIETQIVHLEDGRIKATARVYGDPIRCGDRLLLATGTACEVRTQRGVNSTSAEENGETSAVGRALALAGYDSTGNIASAEEVDNAIQQQEQAKRSPAARSSEPKATKASSGGGKPRPAPVEDASQEASAEGYYGDPSKSGTQRGVDHFKVTNVATANGTYDGNDWTRWDIDCACGTRFSTFDADWGEAATVARQADGDVEIAWTRNKKGYPSVHSKGSKQFNIGGVTAGDFDHITVLAPSEGKSLGDVMQAEIEQMEADRGELPV